VWWSIRSAVVLDRDGVINDHRKFVNGPADFYLFPDTAKAIRMLNDQGLAVYVATNQGGVGLGYMTLQSLMDIHEKMISDLEKQGAKIDDIAYCPHRPDEGCRCRKPNSGMLLALQAKHHFDFEHSFMVGDRETDVDAGIAAGMKTIRIGSERTKADYHCRNLLDAATYILQKTEKSNR
jgi:D-glycero-D-manno-heptose 1,7-bisphosphate phosphatase